MKLSMTLFSRVDSTQSIDEAIPRGGFRLDWARTSLDSSSVQIENVSARVCWAKIKSAQVLLGWKMAQFRLIRVWLDFVARINGLNL